MKKSFRLFTLIATVFVAQNSFAKVIHTCESVQSIKNRATDEICDYFVDASEDCFQKLNERFTLLEARPASTASKDILTEAEPIKESYDAGIATVKTYLVEIKNTGCGDQKERINVMVEELNKDLTAVTKRINELKKK
jgi:hypothetical protein